MIFKISTGIVGFVLFSLIGCATSLKVKEAIESGKLALDIPKSSVAEMLGQGKLLKTERLEKGEILEVRTYRDVVQFWSSVAIHDYWVAFVDDIVVGFGYIGPTLFTAPQPLNCTTTYIGNVARTSCH